MRILIFLLTVEKASSSQRRKTPTRKQANGLNTLARPNTSSEAAGKQEQLSHHKTFLGNTLHKHTYDKKLPNQEAGYQYTVINLFPQAFFLTSISRHIT